MEMRHNKESNEGQAIFAWTQSFSLVIAFILHLLQAFKIEF